MNRGALVSRPDPITDYPRAWAEAVRQQQECDASVNPACRPVLLTRGFRAPVAVVWLHGYTNCPRQFEALGRRCFDRGWNVWIPLAPHHGLPDRMSDATARLNASELARYADRAVDVARGLGDRVVVGGLSMGGCLTAWLGQQRADVDVALSIAPVLSPLPGPPVASRLAAAAIRLLPSVMVWWDRRARQENPGPAHAYFRYSLRGLAEILRLGFSFVDLARRGAPAARAFRFVLNDNDESLGNTLADRILARWLSQGTANVGDVRFPREMELRHDLIDPDQPYQRIDTAYPVLLGAIEDALRAG